MLRIQVQYLAVAVLWLKTVFMNQTSKTAPNIKEVLQYKASVFASMESICKNPVVALLKH